MKHWPWCAVWFEQACYYTCTQLWWRPHSVLWSERLHRQEWVLGQSVHARRYLREPGTKTSVSLHMSSWILGWTLRAGARGTDFKAQHGGPRRNPRVSAHHPEWVFLYSKKVESLALISTNKGRLHEEFSLIMTATTPATSCFSSFYAFLFFCYSLVWFLFFFQFLPYFYLFLVYFLFGSF